MEARNADTQPDPGLPADVLQSGIDCRTGGFTHPTSRQTDGWSFFSSSASFSRASRRMKVSSTVGENMRVHLDGACGVRTCWLVDQVVVFSC